MSPVSSMLEGNLDVDHMDLVKYPLWARLGWFDAKLDVREIEELVG